VGIELWECLTSCLLPAGLPAGQTAGVSFTHKSNFRFARCINQSECWLLKEPTQVRSFTLKFTFIGAWIWVLTGPVNCENYEFREYNRPYNFYIFTWFVRWCGGVTGIALDLRSIGRGFKPYSGQRCMRNNLGQVVHTMCLCHQTV